MCGGGGEGGGELLVEGEEELDALALGGEGLWAVAAVGGAVERGGVGLWGQESGNLELKRIKSCAG